MTQLTAFLSGNIMSQKELFFFFLGGWDGEMVAIRDILQRGEVRYCDKRLSWGAKVSDYEEEIKTVSNDIIPVFIELPPDIPIPENSVILDHHNENSGKKKATSIEQIAKLLGIQLNRRQKLISANDRAFIPGMLELSASEDEIHEIRQFDRKCQGVTEDDEYKAELSINKHLTVLNDGTAYIESLTEKTSPICDRLYNLYKKVLIITPSGELNFFGPGDIVDNLRTNYEKLKKEDSSINFWYGGNLPEFGFFGSNCAINKKEIMNILNSGDDNGE